VVRLRLLPEPVDQAVLACSAVVRAGPHAGSGGHLRAGVSIEGRVAIVGSPRAGPPEVARTKSANFGLAWNRFKDFGMLRFSPERNVWLFPLLSNQPRIQFDSRQLGGDKAFQHLIFLLTGLETVRISGFRFSPLLGK
jgi:hypothetical protein